MKSLRVIRCEAPNPESVLDRELKQFTAASPPELLVLVDFSLEIYWLPGGTYIPLVALYHLTRRQDGVRVCLSVSTPEAVAGDIPRNVDDQWLDGLKLPWFELGQPLRLRPTLIPKPWGQEIWYTGTEQRGVAAVTDGVRDVPLPWLLAVAPARLSHSLQRQLILLKILDPLPDEVFGDLYFELHREKREVYVVTDVNPQAWPDGVGAIRFGFNSSLRASYADDRQFLSDYRAAIGAYRLIRRDMDSQLDAMRVRDGVGVNEPVEAATLKRWIAQLPDTLRKSERESRAAMDAFCGQLPLRVGDVVKVPTLVPHSLQHGVRTVEFQTPVYERLILSFAQKVLTQADWDTEAALSIVLIDPPPAEPFEQIDAADGWVEERIVAFDDFEVRRLSLQPGAMRELRAPRDYALAMAVGGDIQLGEITLAADEAVLLAPIWRGGRVVNPGTAPRALLLAYPNMPAR